MSVVLIVEDEAFLRATIVRGLSRLEIQIEDVGTFQGAVEQIKHNPPDVIISDIDLPDGSGLDLLSLLDEKGLYIPIVFMSAYLPQFREQIPRRSHIEMLEKPVPIAELRSRIRHHLASDTPNEPFSLDEYIQIACIGGHSVHMKVKTGSGDGELIVWSGKLWSAEDVLGTGEAAAFRILNNWWQSGRSVRCRSIASAPEKNLDISNWQRLLMDSTRLSDEMANTVSGGRSIHVAETPVEGLPAVPFTGSADLARAPETPSEGLLAVAHPVTPADESLGISGWHQYLPSKPSEPAASQEATSNPITETGDVEALDPEAFDAYVDEAVDALLAREYVTAYKLFLRANKVKPGDSKVTANLARLRKLGFSDDRGSET